MPLPLVPVLDAIGALEAAVCAVEAATDRRGRYEPIAALLAERELLPGLATGADSLLARLAACPGGAQLEAMVRRAVRGAVAEIEPEKATATTPIAGAGPEPFEADVWARLDVTTTEAGQRAKRSLRNAVLILTHDTRWSGRLRRNLFSSADELDGSPISDRDETAMHLWIDAVYGLDLPTDRICEAASYVASQSSYHPIRDYLSGLEWDGTDRLEHMLTGAFGAEDTALNGVLGRAWMISAVARVMRPGCKVDTTLILVGDQGDGKSSAVRALGHPWTADTVLDLQTKDLFEAIQGVWIYEIAELESFRGREWARIKAILTSQTDRWRRPYARRAEAAERQVCFVGSTNDQQFLGDHTGHRRFWPVRTGVIKLADLELLRDQLWAEATARYQRGEPWHLDADDAAAAAQAADEFAIEDPWEAPVAEWCHGRVDFTVADVLRWGVGKAPGSATRGDQMHAADVLTSLGYEYRGRKTVNGAKVRVWGPRRTNLKARTDLGPTSTDEVGPPLSTFDEVY